MIKIIIALICLLVLVQGKDEKTVSQDQWSAGQIFLAFIVVTAIVLGLAYYYDKKHGFIYSRALRGKIGDCIMFIRRKRSYTRQLSQKVQPQDNQTARNAMYDHEKTYIEAVPQPANPGTEQVLHEQPILPQEIQSDTPEPDFKGVFEIKQSKSKHKINKKSKSKLKGRLLGKGSDNEEEEEPAQLSNMTDQNQNQEAIEDIGGEILEEEYKVMEDQPEN